MLPMATIGRFALVGVVVTLTHVVVASGLIEGVGFSAGTANGIAFVLANALSYVVNTWWSFQSSMGWGTWRRFVAVSVAAWGLTVTIAWGVEAVGGHYLLGILLVVTFVPAVSFAAHHWFTYR